MTQEDQKAMKTVGCITNLAAAVAHIMGIAPPLQAQEPLTALEEAAPFGGHCAQRVLLYHPDAVALWLYQRYPQMLSAVSDRAKFFAPLRSVLPPVTPVCFSSMYTGAAPQVHGVTTYTKPVVQTDTLFDVLLRAGKKPAIVSTQNDSMSLLFLQRDMDYIICPTVEECNEKAQDLIRRDEHDFIAVYNGDYDAAMHRYSPEGAEALQALAANARAFAALWDTAVQVWRGRRAMVGFCTDPGCHEIDGGLGSHGLDMPQDMEIAHFYGFLPENGNSCSDTW